MISIGKLRSEDYYLREVVDGAEDYYVDAGEAPGRWRGRGAEGLGLAGVVDRDALQAAFHGRHAASGEPLLATRRRLPGFDITFSPPKSVSLLWALSSPPQATGIVACLERALGEAERYLEREACRVRRGHAGAENHRGNGFVAAAFLHRTSRLGDPGLHIHYLVMNAAEGPDGRWTALDGRALYSERYTAEAVFQSALRHELARDPGVLFEEVDRHGVGEVAGIPKQVRRAFSRRRIEIEAEMARRGVTSGHGARVATLATRKAKSIAVSEAELRRGWRQRARDLDFSVDSIPRMARSAALHVDDLELGAHVTAQHAAFRRSDLLRAIAGSASQGANLDQLDARADAFLGSEQAVAIVPGEMWTTPEILALERQSVEIANTAREAGAGVANGAAVEEAIRARPSLTDEQCSMVRQLTTSGHRVDMVIGRAGAGKTFALDAVRHAYEASGFHVQGTALAARAAKEIEASSGIRSRTVQSVTNALAAGRHHLDQRSVLVVDEAAMVGTRLLAHLVDEVERAEAKIILVGDAKQLPEIEAGGLFSALARRLGAVELAANLRQRDPAERLALTELREGQVDEALGRLERNGNVIIADNAEALRAVLVADWYQAITEGRQALMAALRRSDVADLNQRAREMLLADGTLGAQVMAVDGVAFSFGDRVMAHENRYDLGLLNGSVGVVVAGGQRGLRLRFDNGRETEVPVSYLVEGKLTHAYAQTVHKAQGSTCDDTFLLGDDGLFAELGYTGLSRGRASNHLYVVAGGHGADPGDHLAHVRRSLSISQAKTAAIDLPDAPVPDVPVADLPL